MGSGHCPGRRAPGIHWPMEHLRLFRGHNPNRLIMHPVLGKSYGHAQILEPGNDRVPPADRHKQSCRFPFTGLSKGDRCCPTLISCLCSLHLVLHLPLFVDRLALFPYPYYSNSRANYFFLFKSICCDNTGQIRPFFLNKMEHKETSLPPPETSRRNDRPYHARRRGPAGLFILSQRDYY